MAVTKEKPAPYAPPKVVLDIIERHRHRGLPAPINGELLMRAGLVSESLAPRTLQALAVLDLVAEDGKPSSQLEGLRLAPEAEYKKRLEEWLKGAYADVFSVVDPTQDDAIRVRDAFRAYSPTGQQDRMVTLFQGLCAAAGLIPEKSATPRSAAPRAQAPRPKPAKVSVRADLKAGAGTASFAGAGLPAALAGLMASLPSPPEKGWTKVERDKFVTTFGAVVDFCYPQIEAGSADPGVEEDEEG